MSVHPIEFRYYSPQMQALFTEEAKLQNWLLVEAALARAHARLGQIPQAAADEITAKANLEHVHLQRVKAIEDEIHHDLMAMVRGLTEVCGLDAGKYVHLGATSYDIEDTALAIQLTTALELVDSVLRDTRDILLDWARRTRTLVCVGRTHGQHAVPTTYGLKFAIWACEFQRHLERLAQARPRIAVGKMSGPVGSQASFGTQAAQLQQMVMEELQLTAAPVANQVIQRDRHAEVVFLLALIAATCEKIGKEIRNLQRNEIGEVFEPFQQKQVGSSAMPQKRNPHKCERICSLARVIRAQVGPALENVALEHERDLTNSACERVVFPEAFILTDYMLRQLNEILRGLDLRADAIERNLKLTGGLIMSERVMLAMVERGMGRQQAHEILRQAAGQVLAQKRALEDTLLDWPEVATLFSRAEITALLDPAGYIGTAVEQVDQVLADLDSK